MNRPPFPAVLDSTLMAHFRACPRSAFLSSFEHWKPRSRSVHLVAGAAFARGLEVARLAYYAEGRPAADAEAAGLKALIESYGSFECPPDSAKSLERMMGAFEFYFHSYPLATDSAKPATLPGGRKGIEFSFAAPIDIAHPETGDPLLYSGRFDMIADYCGGLYGEDDKTASQLGPSWSKSWDLRSQFTAYTWGARSYGIRLEGFLVRGVSILKTKYDTQQAITPRPGWMVDRWYEQLIRDVRRMIECWESGYWDYNLDESCNSYGGCSFRRVCLAPEDRSHIWLAQDFERRAWDPVTRTETVLVEA